jgi:hypothetical protein
MHLLAAATTTADKLRGIPADFWLKALLAIAAFVVAILVLRKIAQMNKVVLAGVAVFVVTMVGFNWIFERNEPSWATPAVTWIGGFFPSKGSYTAKQQQAPLAAPAPVAAQRK